MMSQNEIAEILGYSQPTVNLILTGKRKVSWPLAERIAELFPGSTVQQWKKASPEDLKCAFSQLDKDGAL